VQFRDFIQNLESPYREESLFRYTLRLLFAAFLMEVMCHMFPFFAVLKTGLFNMLSPSEIVVVSYVVLKMMWLKFLIIWRFFRLWALCDGMNPPENMIRCMSNNHSLEGFWRGWHASFNKWILKYIYIPLGGTQSKVWSVWLIFLFVAIWHDFEIKLISWGALNSLFLVVEAIGKRISKTSTYCSLPHLAQYSLEVISGAAYIFVLVGVNMIGYAVGIGGLTTILTKLNSKEGYLVLSYSYGVLLIGVSIMRYYDRLLTRYSNNSASTLRTMTSRKED
jgi:protein-cysteine N-palmitoyltransferase HHAT